MEKPSFREQGNLIILDDSKLIFNYQEIGPMNFNGLRNAYYGLGGFRMSTMPELVQLVYVSFENEEYEKAQNVIKTLKNEWYKWVAGNTGILYTQEGIYVQDNPKIKKGKVLMKQKKLEKKLGKHEERRVVFSDDKTIRFTPYNYKTGDQSSLELSKNTGIIALVGGEEKAEKIAKVSEHYKIESLFSALCGSYKANFPQARVAILHSDLHDRLDVNALISDGDDLYSLSVMGK